MPPTSGTPLPPSTAPSPSSHHQSASESRSHSPPSHRVQSSPTEASRPPKSQALRNQITILRNSLPTPTELVLVRNTNPEEGDRLALYSRRVLAKIAELEAQEKNTFAAEEERRREAIRLRSKENVTKLHESVVETWMFHEISAEDRLAELRARRQQKLAEEAAKREGLIAEAQAQQRAAEEARKQRLLQKAEKWEETVAEMEQRKVQERRQWEHTHHRKSLKYHDQAALARQQEAQRLAEVRARVSEREHELELHAYRAKLNAEEKARIAAQHARCVPLHPDAHERKLESLKDKLRETQERQHAAIRNTLEGQAAKKRELSEKNAAKHAIAQQRIEERTAEHRAHLERIAASIAERDARHSSIMSQQSVEREHRKQSANERAKVTREGVEEVERQRAVRLAEKVMQRTVRIGESFGVMLADIPKLLPPPVAAQPKVPEETAASVEDTEKPVKKAGDQSGGGSRSLIDRPAASKRQKQGQSSGGTAAEKPPACPHLALIVKSSSEFLPSLSLFTGGSNDRLLTVASRRQSQKQREEATPAPSSAPPLPPSNAQKVQLHWFKFNVRDAVSAPANGAASHSFFATISASPKTARHSAKVLARLAADNVDVARRGVVSWSKPESALCAIPTDVSKITVRLWNKSEASDDVVASVTLAVPTDATHRAPLELECEMPGGEGNDAMGGTLALQWLGVDGAAVPFAEPPTATVVEAAPSSSAPPPAPKPASISVELLGVVLPNVETSFVVVTAHDADDETGAVRSSSRALSLQKPIRCVLDGHGAKRLTIKVWACAAEGDHDDDAGMPPALLCDECTGWGVLDVPRSIDNAPSVDRIQLRLFGPAASVRNDVGHLTFRWIEPTTFTARPVHAGACLHLLVSVAAAGNVAAPNLSLFAAMR